MAAQFTPGPWAWNDAGRLYHSIPESFASTNVLVVRDPVWRPSEADANLIATAPEFYDACEEFVRRVDAGEIRSKRTYAKFKALLSKARGETPSTLNLEGERG